MDGNSNDPWPVPVLLARLLALALAVGVAKALPGLTGGWLLL